MRSQSHICFSDLRVSHRDPYKSRDLGICLQNKGHVALLEGFFSTDSGAYGSHTTGNSVGPLVLTLYMYIGKSFWGVDGWGPPCKDCENHSLIGPYLNYIYNFL